MDYSALPPYVVWGPILQTAIIEFIELAGWESTGVIGFWKHKRYPGEELGYLQAFERTRDALFPKEN